MVKLWRRRFLGVVIIEVLRLLVVGTSCAVNLSATVRFLLACFGSVELLNYETAIVSIETKLGQKSTYSNDPRVQSNNVFGVLNGTQPIATHLAAYRTRRAQAELPTNKLSG